MDHSFKILDCTLRDGGYYNRWDFDVKQAERLIAALNSAGVDIIEVGYKSLPKDSYYGLFRYCNESYLQFLKKYKKSEYAFMVDAAEFIHQNKLNTVDLDAVIPKEEESVFQWVRIASHFKTIAQMPELVEYFRNKGYKVGFNLMGGSLLEKEQLEYALKLMNDTPIDVFYIADSFGSFDPSDMVDILKVIKNNYSGKIGVHTHDNMGMAYANTKAALEEGVLFIDGTVTGMGRGAGNLSTEQFLLGYSATNKNVNPNALLSIIHDYIDPLKEQYKWGYNFTYMLSGMLKIHPTYCQKLSEGNKFSIHQISNILSNIPSENRAKFDQACLDKVVKSSFKGSDHSEGVALRQKEIVKKEQDAFVVARGPSLENVQQVIKQLLQKKNIKLLECNHSGFFDDVIDRSLILFNRMRFNAYLQKGIGQPNEIVTGEQNAWDFDNELNMDQVFHFPYEIGELSLKEEQLIIPDYEAGQFTIALAVLNGAKKVYVAGFDGYDAASKNQRMDEFFQSIQKKYHVEIIAVTPTHYQNVIHSSIYTL